MDADYPGDVRLALLDTQGHLVFVVSLNWLSLARVSALPSWRRTWPLVSGLGEDTADGWMG